jgi:hypothetical protein
LILFKIPQKFTFLTLATPLLLPLRENPTRLNSKSSIHASIAILPNASLSSSQSTDESSASVTHQPDSATNKLQLFRRMLSLRGSTNAKPATYRSYNLRAFEVPHDHYSIIVHFLDETERTFQVDVSNLQCTKEKLFKRFFPRHIASVQRE